jgi:NADH-quinone oxidoreductase subunit H
MSTFIVNLFFGGWIFIAGSSIFIKYLSIFIYFLKILFFCFLFIYARGIMPRYRYDQLMRIGWRYLLPVVFLVLLLNIIIVYFFLGIDVYAWKKKI